MQNDFSKRLKHFRSQRHLTQRGLAELVGVSQKLISDYEMGISQPRQSTLLKILEALNVDEHEFFNSISATVNWENEKLDNAYVTYVSNDGQKIILPYQYQLSPKNTIAHKHNGNSMEPTLKDGDLLLVNTLSPLSYGELYLIELQGISTVFRVYPAEDGKLLLDKDNPFYKSIIVNTDNLNILGKVVFRQGFL